MWREEENQKGNGPDNQRTDYVKWDCNWLMTDCSDSKCSFLQLSQILNILCCAGCFYIIIYFLTKLLPSLRKLLVFWDEHIYYVHCCWHFFSDKHGTKLFFYWYWFSMKIFDFFLMDNALKVSVDTKIVSFEIGKGLFTHKVKFLSYLKAFKQHSCCFLTVGIGFYPVGY